MHKILSISVLCALCFLLGSNAFAAACDENASNFGFEEYSRGKYSYLCNVKNLCPGNDYGGDGWNFDTTKQLIKEHDPTKYDDLEKKDIDIAKSRQTYVDTQNQIINCATLKSQKTLHDTVLKFNISERSKEFLKKANEKITQQMNENSCILQKSNEKVFNYDDLLDSMSYEECVYSFYNHYVNQVVENNIGKLSKDGDTQITQIMKWKAAQGAIKNRLGEEGDLMKRTLDTALMHFATFERTYPSFVLLQIIEIDLAEIKRKL